MCSIRRRPIGKIYQGQIWPVKVGYNLASKYYDSWCWQNFWKANEAPLVSKEIFACHSYASPALDVGTGTGFYASKLVELGIQCTALDICRSMLDEARRKLPKAVKLVCSAVEKTPFPNTSFNLVLICRVLSHISNLRVALTELARVTNAGGKLIFSDVSANHNYDNVRIPIPGEDVHIEVHKHSVDKLVQEAENTGCWKMDFVEMIFYKDLIWKPNPSEYPAIDATSERPIFFYGTLTRINN